VEVVLGHDLQHSIHYHARMLNYGLPDLHALGLTHPVGRRSFKEEIGVGTSRGKPLKGCPCSRLIPGEEVVVEFPQRTFTLHNGDGRPVRQQNVSGIQPLALRFDREANGTDAGRWRPDQGVRERKDLSLPIIDEHLDC